MTWLWVCMALRRSGMVKLCVPYGFIRRTYDKNKGCYDKNKANIRWCMTCYDKNTC